ncbi:sensor histidine kinase [Lutispora thermophila]|uniref:histidine kinase n=1 Tax=Lutispora thermophila DSM 19022 TaxID=1122184 RepID=A0A1M6EG10_9FIRM|nr:HAMP domain-containing sensor histidine kinase [Lutispora thermophila]SHI84381.1 Signal transduction histidine kinase [Lutispora thermophila DSM 19022]
MKKSIFQKLFITYGITIILGFGILALVLMKLFSQYFIDSKKDLLLEYGQKITQDIAIGLYSGRLDRETLIEDLKILDKFLDARIWIIDRNGMIFGVSGTNEEQYLGQQVDNTRLGILYRGRNIIETGNFGGKFREPVLTVGYPIFYNDEFEGAVLVHASMPGIQKSFRDIYNITILAIIFSGLFAYVILYFQIKRISMPLMEISKAAKVISGGEFQKRLEIKTGDEIEELAKSFNDMAESLEKIEENRRNFIANISHDLRSPMTSIKGFVGGIMDGTIPPEMQGHYLNIVMDECQRLIKMTNELLELNNIQQGKVEVNKTNFELNEMLRRKLINFENEITKKNIDVMLKLHDDSTLVNADKAMMERIITNLLDNAVKFTEENGYISLRTREEKSKVVVEIINTCENVDEIEIKNMWERFHKGDQTRGIYKSGFGLGLSIVKEMIILQGEKIWADKLDGAIRFSFTIGKAK